MQDVIARMLKPLYVCRREIQDFVTSGYTFGMPVYKNKEDVCQRPRLQENTNVQQMDYDGEHSCNLQPSGDPGNSLKYYPCKGPLCIPVGSIEEPEKPEDGNGDKQG